MIDGDIAIEKAALFADKALKEYTDRFNYVCIPATPTHLGCTLN